MPMSEHLSRIRARVGTELLVMPSVTAIIRDPGNRVLLVKTVDRGVWVAPGGAVDPHETPADAVVRETWEETGLVVEPTALLGVYGGPEFLITYPNGDRTSYLMSVFECAVIGGEARPDGVETCELRYVAEPELATLAMTDWAPVVFPDVFRPDGRPRFRAPSWRPPEHR